MTFECYVPYTKEDLSVIETLGGEVEEFYFSVEELIEHCGIDSPITKMTMSGLEIENDDGFKISFDDIGIN